MFYIAEKAAQFKEEGNVNFKAKNYRRAIDCYTEGIRLLCNDKELNAILFGNRSASHFYLGRYVNTFKLIVCNFVTKIKIKCFKICESDALTKIQ